MNHYLLLLCLSMTSLFSMQQKTPEKNLPEWIMKLNINYMDPKLKMLCNELNASQKISHEFRSIILAGQQGAGKHSMAFSISQELNAQSRCINSNIFNYHGNFSIARAISFFKSIDSTSGRQVVIIENSESLYNNDAFIKMLNNKIKKNNNLFIIGLTTDLTSLKDNTKNAFPVISNTALKQKYFEQIVAQNEKIASSMSSSILEKITHELRQDFHHYSLSEIEGLLNAAQGSTDQVSAECKLIAANLELKKRKNISTSQRDAYCSDCVIM